MQQSEAHSSVARIGETILPVVIAAASWGVRSRHDYAGVVQDLKWVMIFVAWQYLELFQNAAVVVFYAYFLLGRNSVMLCITTACSLWTLYMYRSMVTLHKHQQLDQVRRDHDSDAGLKHLDLSSSRLRPLLFPSRVAHTRKFPKMHSFTYSYLMVGIPVGWRGSIGTFLSADIKSLPWQGRQPLAAWFSVESADHLARGDSVHGLQGKLEEYLCSIKEDPEQFDDAYLIAAPTFLGYSFNPASFWYLYSKQKLEAMVVEVSNTFDEKRMYFLRDMNDASDNSTAGNLTAKWAKDFHVSPFNSRKGSYGMTSLDPFQSPSAGEKISNSIQLYSSKNALKIVARIVSSSPAIDPSTMSSWNIFIFIASWWWVGMVTFPRILREAAKLFFRRGLSVWYRPEVQKDSIARNATKEELDIAALFGDFLRTRVENSTIPVPLCYTPCTNSTPKEEIYHSKSSSSSSPSSKHTPSIERPIIFRPTSPAFYAKIARSANLTDAVVPQRDPLKSLFHTSHPSTVFDLLGVKAAHHTQPAHRTAPNASFFQLPDLVRARWMLIKVLRNMSIKSFILYDHQAYLSDLDWFAIARATSPKSNAYRRATIKLLASDFLTLGMPEVIDLAVWAVRVWLCWLHVAVLVGGQGKGGGSGGGQTTTSWKGDPSQMLHVALRFLGPHLWWALGRLL